VDTPQWSGISGPDDLVAFQVPPAPTAPAQAAHLV